MCTDPTSCCHLPLEKLHHGRKIRIIWLSSCQHSSSEPGTCMENVFPKGCKPGNSGSLKNSAHFLTPEKEEFLKSSHSRAAQRGFVSLQGGLHKILKCCCFPKFSKAAALQGSVGLKTGIFLGKENIPDPCCLLREICAAASPKSPVFLSPPCLKLFVLPKKLLDPPI